MSRSKTVKRRKNISVSHAKQIVLPALTKSVSAVVSVSNEEKTIAGVLGELERLPLQDIIIVMNGCTDDSFQMARKQSRAAIVHYPERIGHDVGRAIGSRMTNSDIVLFIDGDIVISAAHLIPFIEAANQGVDIALNDISPFVPPFSRQDDVTRLKYFLNRVLGRDDLQYNSLTAVPHALSRRAIHTIGVNHLLVPPKAHALAILKGLTVRAVHTVDVISNNRVRTENTGPESDVARLIIGDHIEAIKAAMDHSGTRLHLSRYSRAELAKWRNSL
ncbi:glycosyltransferase [Paenibacillus sediminis]|uniref:Glycosyltransferase involved in cell wall biosynthesis n=1 Tax=Paenibacillus sediminis TaxID=664909 RepID=A0ABS4H5R2_9BACL|nr:glycosyltransferase [Paenibacillus sediminis]MBP1937880.1 glycosyltransferase involved in cell wall biosynthesis [Paenibacillus sediminis]